MNDPRRLKTLKRFFPDTYVDTLTKVIQLVWPQAVWESKRFSGDHVEWYMCSGSKFLVAEAWRHLHTYSDWYMRMRLKPAVEPYRWPIAQTFDAPGCEIH